MTTQPDRPTSLSSWIRSLFAGSGSSAPASAFYDTAEPSAILERLLTLWTELPPSNRVWRTPFSVRHVWFDPRGSIRLVLRVENGRVLYMDYTAGGGAGYLFDDDAAPIDTSQHDVRHEEQRAVLRAKLRVALCGGELADRTTEQAASRGGGL